MNEPTGSRRDAASTLFNLPDYRVIDAADQPDGTRRVLVESLAPPGCPTCGVISERVHARRLQTVRDIPVAGRVRVVWSKRRWRCVQVPCPRRTFWESTIQVPRRARSTARLKDALVGAVVASGRSAAETARAHGVSWWLVQAALSAVAVLLPPVDDLTVRRLGIDEHRYRLVRWFRDDDGAWKRFEPWMSTFVDLDTGVVIGVVDGRDSAGVGAWLEERSTAWRARIEVVAIDPSAAFRRAITVQLPAAKVSVDAFHLVKLANDMVTKVRQRSSRDQHGRRGTAKDPAWAHRLLLLRGANTLTPAAWTRLERVLRTDDPTDEIGAAWGIKEQLRRVLACTDVDEARNEKMRLGHYVLVAKMPEADKLFDTICAWWTEIEVLITTRVTNARTEAANTTIKNIKRTGRGFRNPENYRTRILLTNAAKIAA